MFPFCSVCNYLEECWDVTPRSLVLVHSRFGGNYCLHLQGWNVSQATKLCFPLASYCSLLGLLFGSQGRRSTFFRNVGEFLPDYTLPHPRQWLIEQFHNGRRMNVHDIDSWVRVTVAVETLQQYLPSSVARKRSEVRDSKYGRSCEIFTKETITRAFGNCLLRASAAPVKDTVTFCPSEPLPWLLMRLKKKVMK